jgi:trehalose synthase
MKLLKIFVTLNLFILLCSFDPLEKASPSDIHFLETNSMLYQSEQLANKYSGNSIQWHHPYGIPQPEKVCELAPAWFTSYSLAIIPEEGKTVLETLASDKLWSIFEEIGLQAIHTGPMKIAGGIISEEKRSPTVDGGFDRISLTIDPAFGTLEQYLQMVKTAQNHKAVVAGDLVPGHTGLGYDFHLALRNYKDYPGIYHMVEINEKDWDLLPQVPLNKLNINLSKKDVKRLKQKGYIVGELERVIFYEKGIKETNWDVTAEIEGVDGVKRRWVYLHYFKAGQPSLNWLDPSFAANKVVSGDIMKSIGILKNSLLRLDANPFLGVEINPTSSKAWSEGHPLSVCSTNLISMLTRKLGGYTFQELNEPISDIRFYSQMGPDLSYDFITRTSYAHALINQDTELLRLVSSLLYKCSLSPINFIHSLQNHDEFNYELIHFSMNPNETFTYNNKQIKGKNLGNQIRKNDFKKFIKDTNYNFSFGNGIACTIVGLCAASLKIKDIYNMTEKEKEKVKKAHLLLAFFNAMQPGVFALSGWDLVGALPLEKKQIPSLLEDGDTRWLNRGAYDLLGNTTATHSPSGLLKAKTIYGPLPKQLKDPNSFINNIKKYLNARKSYKLHLADLVSNVEPKNKQLFGTIYKLPSNNLALIIVNFGQTEVKEDLVIEDIKDTYAINMLTNVKEYKDFSENKIAIKLEPLEGKSIIFRKKPSYLKK